jgi:hypothetical protein
MQGYTCATKATRINMSIIQNHPEFSAIHNFIP